MRVGRYSRKITSPCFETACVPSQVAPRCAEPTHLLLLSGEADTGVLTDDCPFLTQAWVITDGMRSVQRRYDEAETWSVDNAATFVGEAMKLCPQVRFGLHPGLPNLPSTEGSEPCAQQPLCPLTPQPHPRVVLDLACCS